MVIFDTKCKGLVDNPRISNGISQADMYQMYVYAKKYGNKLGSPEVWLDDHVYSNEKCKVLFISAEANGNEYSAVIKRTSNTVNDYLEYHRVGNDNWRGKMRELLSELYLVICRIE